VQPGCLSARAGPGKEFHSNSTGYGNYGSANPPSCLRSAVRARNISRIMQGAEQRFSRHVLSAIAALVICVAGCGGGSESPTTPTPTSAPFLSFTSTAGDLVGRGRSDRIDLTRVTFSGGVSDNNRVLHVQILGAPGLSSMILTLGAAPGQMLARGNYPNAKFDVSGVTLSFGIAGSACPSTGQFEVLDIAFGPSGGFGGYSASIQRLHATFRQSCNGSPSDSISGEVLLLNTPLG